MKGKVISMKSSVYCKCGGKMVVSAPPHIVEQAVAMFWQIHNGEGHEPCNAATAAKARRKADQQATERGGAR